MELLVFSVSSDLEIQGRFAFWIVLYSVDQRPDKVLVFILRLGTSIEYGCLPAGSMLALARKWFPIEAGVDGVKSESLAVLLSSCPLLHVPISRAGKP